MSSIEYGPSREDTMLVSRGLDYYKPTMSQLAYEKEPQATVTLPSRTGASSDWRITLV